MPDSSRSLYVTSLSLVGFIIPLHLGQYTDLISIFFTTFSRLLTSMQSTMDTTIPVHPVASELCHVPCKAAVKESVQCTERALHEFPSSWNRLRDPWSSVMKTALSQDPCKVDSSPRSHSNKLWPWQRHFHICLVRSEESQCKPHKRLKEDTNYSDTDKNNFLLSC